MSSRELRNFTEILRVLGYPPLVSLESFRLPNFPLVAEILHWLIQRFEPSIESTFNIETEQQRVRFIKSIAQLLVVKVGIKVSMRKLYMADGHAVQEMLKICNFLYTASSTLQNPDDEDEAEKLSEARIISKINELRKSRGLSMELTERSARLYELLGKEVSMREQRMFVLNRNLSHSEVESFLRNSIKSVEFELTKVTDRIENVSMDESNLDIKIEKRKEDLERYQKRLSALKSVRPAFMDEFEKLEQELITYYDLYVLKFRCLAFLEQQLEEVEKSEVNQIKDREARISTMIESMKESNGNVDRDNSKSPVSGEEEEDAAAIKSPPGTTNGEPETTREKLNKTTAAIRRVPNRGKVLESMESTQNDSLDSELDLDGDDDEDGSDLDSEDELELVNLTKGSGKGKKKAESKNEAGLLSDDDF